MKNIKLELFNFKKNLTLDQEDISRIVEGHIAASNEFSEKDIINSLGVKLNPYTYDSDVKSLLESFAVDFDQYQLVYELKHLYSVLNKKNQGEVYRHPINVLLQTINVESDQDRMAMVLNELAIYDWVPEIKLFVHNLTKSPEQKSNLLSGGSSESIFTIVESVEDGHVAYVNDAWFFLGESVIEKTNLDIHVKDMDKLRILNTLQTAMSYATVSDERIDFRVSEGLTIGLSVVKDGVIFINEDEMNQETTLESLFNSPIIPLVNKNFYPLLMETIANLDKFVELDIVKKISNLINPYLEAYAFNYKDNVYLYRCDERNGKSFYKYDDSLSLVNEVRNELNYDLTFFYEDKINKEVIVKRKLEDKEREITLKLEDVDFNISKVVTSLEHIGGSEVLETALTQLNGRKKALEDELQIVKEQKYSERVQK